MRHGYCAADSDDNQPSSQASAVAAAAPVCPFGAYTSLFGASPVGVAENAASAQLKAMIEEIAAARSSGVDDPPARAAGAPARADDNIPAGYTYFGQLVVHDLTHSITIATRDGAPPALRNLSTPNLDLDTIYGGGPDRCPHLYQPPYMPRYTKQPPNIDDDGQHLFYLGRTAKPAFPENWRQGHGLPFDLPRVDTGSRGTAETAYRTAVTPLVHDDRNDDNLILAQLTAQFMLVHNTVANYLRRNGLPNSNGPELSNREAFELARHFMLRAYRRIVVHDFLRRLLLESVYDSMMGGRIQSHGHVPVEFVFGAARLGHAMVRGSYTINASVDPAASGLGRLMSFSGHTPNANLPLPADWVVDWRHLLEIDDHIAPQSARRISPFLAPTFVYGRFVGRPGEPRVSLSFQDLWRCYELGLPSGQDYARQWFGDDSPDVLSGDRMRPTATVFAELHTADNLIAALNNHPDFLQATPLSYYLLQEAALLGEEGRHLGPLGSYIFAATILHALQQSPAIPPNQRGLAFQDLLGGVGIATLPELLEIPDLPDDRLETRIAETLD